ncbi:MAG TPA: hypothetical protein VJ888_04240 [Mobilitalea sp.]|nr:hypothetical protein [Mobilitalea sp.]
MRKQLIKKAKIFVGTCLVFTGLFFIQEHSASASALPDAVTINQVDYEEEEVVINNNGNGKIYFATEVEASKDNWEVLSADAGVTTRIDFSWVSPSIENIIVVRGEDVRKEKQVRVVLTKVTRKLDISINYATMNSLAKNATIAPILNIMTTAGTGDQPITFDDLEWKKGEGGKWKPVSDLTVAQVEKYQIKGTNLYFRIKAVNVPSDNGSKGRRASSDTKVKISKKAAATGVGVDGSEFTVAIKYGMEYRLTVGTAKTNWIKVYDRSKKRLELTEILENINNVSDGLTVTFPEMLIETRDYATSRKAASKITNIILAGQRPIPGILTEGKVPDEVTEPDLNVYVDYIGVKNMTITIPTASTTNPYEYCVVKPDDVFDLDRAVWSTISKGTAVKVLASKAVEDGVLHVRQKEIKFRSKTRTADQVDYALASTMLRYDINYPSIPVVTEARHTFVKNIGDTKDIVIEIKLNTIGNEAFEKGIESIKLGKWSIAFVEPPVITPEISAVHPFDATNEYIMTVTIDNLVLETLPNCYDKALYITFNNKTMDKTSVKLTIKPPTSASTMVATPTKGSTGATTINVGTPGLGNSFYYLITDAPIDNVYLEEDISKYPARVQYNSGDNITVAADKYITVFEAVTPSATTKGYFKRFKCTKITGNMIG